MASGAAALSAMWLNDRHNDLEPQRAYRITQFLTIHTEKHIGAKLYIENIDEMGDNHTKNGDLIPYSYF